MAENPSPSILIDKNVSKELSTRIGIENLVTKYDVADIKKDIPQVKRFAFDNFSPSIQDIVSNDEDRTISAGIDYIFGEPFFIGETYSIEGYSNTGKTRLVVKVATEIAKSSKVLFIDADGNLSSPILANIASSMNVNIDYPVYRDPRIPPTSVSALTIVNCLNHPDIINYINEYLQHSTPELIVIDSLLSVFQNVVGKGAPGSAQLEELSLELKSLAKSKGCVVIVTNSIKSPQGTPVTYLGPQYASLWHNRLILATKNNVVAESKLICSPRLPLVEKQFYLEDMKLCETSD
ncbi:hypothetical protein TVAG_453730 [Trichomonas vaginalis G3]|uniref:Uncharacterized protein n=1 Tax=Trichomonas vaginalis (strain ATCC PRA-98 / G3) TaxID=412133 RepID=A2DPU9_TRIV3|nr:DNA repair protein RAD51-like protein 4 family [Trichomonas vaginalis G3]EAY17545.1 hypothetical protein TVAG_453730 [Trichomonas vaginalis G3]KAI5520589.1 DNA repair protein RAD51-like protein 4 family [Trichomonas vaginalis G3]|eukprot:XP_001329680.1 hypothetical protein [Trichomonas vaginalis G3]